MRKSPVRPRPQSRQIPRRTAKPALHTPVPATAVQNSGEAQYRLLFEANPNPMWIFDEDSLRFLEVNREATLLYGWSREEFLTMTVHDVRPPEEARKLAAKMASQRGSRETFVGEWRHWKKDRSLLDVEVTISCIEFNGRQARLTLVKDVTLRKQSEAALRASEARFRALVQASSDVVYHMSADWTEMRHLVSRNFIPDTLEPTRAWLQKYIHPDDRKQVLAAIRKAIRSRSVFELEHRVVRVDGTLGWTFSRAIPILNAKGRIVEWYGMASDVTARRHADMALKAELDATQKLADLGSLFAREGDLKPVLTAVVDAAIEITGANAGRIQLLDPSSGNLKVVAQSGPTKCWHDTAWTQGLDGDSRGQKPHGGELLTTPMLGRSGERLGLLLTHYPSLHGPEQRELSLLDLLARQAADLIERVRAESALRASEEKYRQLFESIDQGFCTIDMIFDELGRPVDYRFLIVNPAFERQTGIANAAGRRMRDIAPLHEQYWFDIYGRIALTGVALRFENVATQFQRVYDVFAWRVGLPSQHRVAVLFNDITDRKQAEQSLRDSEERLQKTQAIAHLGSWDLDLATRRLTLSPEFYRIFGLQPGEFPATYESFLDCVHPDDRGQVDSAYRRSLLDGQESYDLEYRIRRQISGECRYIHGKCEHLRNAAGQVVRSIGMVHDITERKLSEARLQELNATLEQRVADRTRELRQREERLRAILNTVVDAVVTIDGHGIIIGVNPATERMFGYTEGEMLGQNVKMLMPPPYREEHDSYIERFRRTGVAKIIGSGREVQAQRKDGSLFPIELAVSQVDHMQIFTGVIRDISQRRNLEREILNISESERASIGQDLHDDLGQQLAGIWLLCDSMKSSLAREGSSQGENAAKITTLLKNALVLTRSLARGLHPVAVQGGGLVNALKDLALRTRDIFHADCLCTCPASIELDETTATHLYRIAQEAVTNAIKHADSARISIHLDADQERVLLTVKDNGGGDGKEIARLSDEWQGMGLRIMHYRAKLIGGHLSIQRHRSGRGTSVVCTVPLPQKPNAIHFP